MRSLFKRRTNIDAVDWDVIVKGVAAYESRIAECEKEIAAYEDKMLEAVDIAIRAKAAIERLLEDNRRLEADLTAARAMVASLVAQPSAAERER